MKKNTSNKTKHFLVDSSLFVGQNYFNNDGGKLYLIFQPIYKTIAKFSCLIDTICEWESRRLPNEKLACTYTANVCPKLILMNNFKIRLKFKRRR